MSKNVWAGLALATAIAFAGTAQAEVSFEPRKSGGGKPQVGLGVGLGSFDVVTLRYDRFDFGVGIDDFGFTFDYRLDNKLITSNRKFDWMYLFVGGIYNADADDDHDHHHHDHDDDDCHDECDELGARVGIGGHVFFNQLELFAQAMPTLYVIEDTDLELEGLVGARFWF